MIIFNKKNCCYSIAGLLIAPGINNIDSSKLESLKEHDLFKGLVEKGVFKIKNEKSINEIKEEIAIEINSRKKDEIIEKIEVNEVKGDFDKKQVKSKNKKEEVTE